MVNLCGQLNWMISCDKTTRNEEKPTRNGAKTGFQPIFALTYAKNGQKRSFSEKIIMVNLCGKLNWMISCDKTTRNEEKATRNGAKTSFLSK